MSANNPERGINSRCQKARKLGESKSNTCNIEVAMKMRYRNDKLDGTLAADIKVITPYADQMRCYEREYEKVTKQVQLETHPFPEVRIIDSMRGHLAPIIIYDMVLTCGGKSHGMGTCEEGFRANIAAILATNLSIIVESSEILTGFLKLFAGTDEIMKYHELLPYIVSYIKNLKEEGLISQLRRWTGRRKCTRHQCSAGGKVAR